MKNRSLKKAITLLVLLLFSISLIAGCGTRQATQDDEALQIYAAYGNTANILEAFTAATGIKAEFIDMSSGEVLSRMRAEKGKALGDVWFGGGVDSFMVAAEEDLLHPYISPESEFIDDRLKDPNGYWTGVSIVLVTFVVNKDLAETKGVPIPQTWEELIDPQYKDEILMPNPGISGTAFTAIASILQRMGEEDGWAFIEKLDANMPYYAERGNEPPQKASMGEIMIGISPDGINSQREGYPVEVIYPQDGTAWWHSPVAIIAGTDKLEKAQAFVDWTLTPEGQEILAFESPRPAVRPGVTVPDDVERLENLNLVEYDFALAAQERDRIVEQWNQRFGN